MREFTATVNRRGQITLPVSLRRELALKPYDYVTLAVENGHMRIEGTKPAIDQPAGSVTPISRPEDFKALSTIAKDEVAERYARKFLKR